MLTTIRILVKNGPFTRLLSNSMAVRSVASSQIIGGKDIIIKSTSPDEVSQKLRSATDTVQVLNVISEQPNLSPDQVIQSLETIFQLQKSGMSSLKNNQLLKHPEFEDVCRNVNKVCRKLDINQVIEALKVFSFIGVPSNSKIMTTLLSLIRHQINDITLHHIIFLDFLLGKFEKTPLVEALTIALPMLFTVQLPLQIDHENVKELADCIGFVSKNKVSDQCVASLVTALTLHGEDLSAYQASFIVRCLVDIPYEPRHDRLIKNCLNVLAKRLDELDFLVVDSVLSKITEKPVGSAFYHEEFLNKCAEYAVKNDPGSAKHVLYSLRKFNKIAYVNYELLNHLINHCVKNPDLIQNASPGFLLTIVNSLSTANYITAEWELLNEQILKNTIFYNHKIELPWLKFAVEYMSLGGWHEPLIERLFSDSFLNQYFDRASNKIDHLLLVQLYQAVRTLRPEYKGQFPSQMFLAPGLEMIPTVDSPLLESLQYIYGTSMISRVRTKLGHFIDHVVFFDSNTLEPVEIENRPEAWEDAYLEDLLEDKSKITIAISVPPKSHCVSNIPNKLKGMFEMKVKSLETLTPTIVVFRQHWLSLNDNEKLPYLEQLVNEKKDNELKSK